MSSCGRKRALTRGDVGRVRVSVFCVLVQVPFGSVWLSAFNPVFLLTHRSEANTKCVLLKLFPKGSVLSKLMWEL